MRLIVARVGGEWTGTWLEDEDGRARLVYRGPVDQQAVADEIESGNIAAHQEAREGAERVSTAFDARTSDHAARPAHLACLLALHALRRIRR